PSSSSRAPSHCSSSPSTAADKPGTSSPASGMPPSGQFEAEIPTEALKAASYPKLVICGTWEDAPELYRTYAGEALMACADGLAPEIDAAPVRVPGCYPHTQQADRVTSALTALWAGGGSPWESALCSG